MEDLKTLITELAIREITARTGPRTGAFALDPQVINAMVDAGKSYHSRVLQSGTFKTLKPKPEKHVFSLKNPVTGKPTRISATYFWDNDGKLTAWFQPHQMAQGGRIYFNLSRVPPSTDWTWFRSIIAHELTHLFDKQSMEKAAASDAEGQDYYQAPREKKAYLHQFIYEMTVLARSIADDITSGKDSARLLAQTLIKKPQYLIRNVINRDANLRGTLEFYIDDKEFMKQMLKAAFDITRGIIEPVMPKA